ncbi:MFS transporter [Protaetiibacter larvae]|uniref:MFS transporter n=1 Tax=Protaetiibacter larvae TaxID=2592654 RepID=A0A5C1Y5L7_9MICO|nr:MFS transporter [Protaetiibacter larvae]QEO09086.1 MFS transporter [Protaetiibacter larvae]
MTTSPARTARPAHATAWRNATFAVFALNGLGAATWVIRIPAIRDHLELSTSAVGYLIFGVSAGSIVGLLLASHVIQWLGGRRSIGIMLTVCAVALVVIGVGTSVIGSFAVVVAGMALYGFGSAICDVAMNVEGAAVEKAIGRTIMPLFHASWSAGMVVGTSIGTAAAFAGIDPAIHFSVLAVLLLIGAAFAPRAIPRVATHAETGEAVEHVSFRDRMGIWLEPRTLAIGLIALGMAFTEGSAGDWLSLGLVDDRGLENGQAAALFTVFTAAMMVGRLVGGPLIDRLGRVAMVRITGAAAAVGLALVIFVPIIPIAVVGIVLWGLGASLGFPIAMSAAADEPARAAARVSAVATVGYCAFLVGPPLLGVVGEHVGVLNALLIVFGLIILATLAAPAARERAAARRPL